MVVKLVIYHIRNSFPFESCIILCVLLRFMTSLPNIVYLNTTCDLGIDVDEVNIFTALYILMYGLQLLNKCDITCHLIRRAIKGILITCRIHAELTRDH